MNDFFQVLKRFVPPYKKYLFLNIFFNILAAFLTLFSFALIIPILEMLFMGDKGVVYHFMEWDSASLKDVAINNFYYAAYYCKTRFGASMTLMGLSVILVFMTGLKTGATYLSSHFLIPIRAGIVRDIRNYVYDKIVGLPIGFFTSERKGDVMARMSGDVAEIENSIMASLDMMFKNPIMIIVCLVMMITISWELTLFVFILLPIAGLIMGRVGKRLKRTSLEAQNQWGALMATIEETLGGLRIIKAFNAAFDSLTNELAAISENGDQAEISRLKRELGTLYVKCKQNAIKYIYTHPKSLSVIPVLYQKTSSGLPVFAQATDAILMERVYDTLRTVYPASPYLVSLADEVSLRRNALEIQNRMASAEEVDFPEIVLSDVNGQQQSLTALKGNVIVLMFWDASNVQQRVYNTDLKMLYEKYHRRGLEIYQVGLNSNKTAWAMQVKEQGLPWISVCDPAAGASVGAMLYNITQLPSMYVISRDGSIQSRDVFDMRMLENEIRRLL